MSKIRNNFNISYPILNKSKTVNCFKRCELSSDIFQKNSNITFGKLKESTYNKCDSALEITVLPDVSSDFVTRVTECINNFPSKWLYKLKEDNYRIILAPTFQSAYKSQKVFDPFVGCFEKRNPNGTLGVTYSSKKNGKNFIVFCDKPLFSDINMRGIVNHELSHGVVNITGLDKNLEVLELIKKDVASMIKEQKLDKLTPKERLMVSHYFFNSKAYLPIDEIVADVYAWNQGDGFYGSELVLDVYNNTLMKNLFPSLSDYLKVV